MPLQTGIILKGRYRIDQLLGEGGFGAVYRARDMTFGTLCAIKESRDPNPDAQQQFQYEAKILHTLRHPNLPLVTDYFSYEQGQYLVMDFIEGEDLQERLDKSIIPLSEEQVVEWMVEIGNALSYLHNQDPPVIHRDVKPANIKITPEGKAVLVDFGISKVLDPKSRTLKGARAMSPGYSPYEQYGYVSTDARTDVYALGATAYTLLTGRVPLESITRMAGEKLLTLRECNSEISPIVDSAVMRAMALMPQDRYQTVDEFCNALIGRKNEISQQEGEIKSEGVISLTKPTMNDIQTFGHTKMIDEESLDRYHDAHRLYSSAEVIGDGTRRQSTEEADSIRQRSGAKDENYGEKTIRWVTVILITFGLVVFAASVIFSWQIVRMPDRMSGEWRGHLQFVTDQKSYPVYLDINNFQKIIYFTGDITIEKLGAGNSPQQVEGKITWLNRFEFRDEVMEYSVQLEKSKLHFQFKEAGSGNGEVGYGVLSRVPDKNHPEPPPPEK